MSIVSAAIVANGWVLALTYAAPVLTTAERSFGSEAGEHPLFPLDPSGTPKITVTQTGLAGFARSGGQAVATVVDGPAIVGVKPLRTPYAASAPGSNETTSYLDQTDNGNGTVTMRFALSERVLAGATVTATFAAGWRNGFSGGTVNVTNNSARAAVLPIVRYATPNVRLVRGASGALLHTARVESVVASHYARHDGIVLHQAVAAVRYSVTDGTTVRHFWFTAPVASDAYGDGALVWGGDIDLSAGAPGTPLFTSGVLTIHRSVFPWVGAARHTCGTDPAVMTAAALHSTDLTASFAAASDRPAHLCYDPDGTRYRRAIVVVTVSGGSTTASAITVGGNTAGVDRATALAAAKAGTKAASITHAAEAIRLAARSLSAANGFASAVNRLDWAEIVFEAGTHAGSGGFSVGSSAGTSEGRLLITGETGAVWNNNGASATLRASRGWLSGLTLEHSGSSTFVGSASAIWHLDQCIVRAAAGGEAVGVNIVPAVAGVATWLSATRTTWTGIGSGMAGSSQRFSLIRACTTARKAEALALIHTAQVFDATVSYTSGGAPDSFGGWDADTGDQMIWGCTALRNNGRFYVPGRASGAGTAASPTTCLRFALVNCLAARAGVATAYKFVQIGENAAIQFQDSLIEGSTFVGQRLSFHNDPPVATDNLAHTGNSVRGCYMDRLSSKADTYPTASANRLGSWETHYGVGNRDNVFGERASLGGDQFTLQSYGLNVVRAASPGPGTVSNALFVNDQSNWSVNATTPGANGVGTAEGDYRIQAGSPLAVRAAGALSAATVQGGTPRGMVAGAMAVAAFAAASTGARQAQAAGAALLGVGVTLGLAAAWHGQAVRAGLLGVTADMGVAGARHAGAAGAGSLRVTSAMVGAPARHLHAARTAETAVTIRVWPVAGSVGTATPASDVRWVGAMRGEGAVAVSGGRAGALQVEIRVAPGVAFLAARGGAGALALDMAWMPGPRVRRVAAETRVVWARP